MLIENVITPDGIGTRDKVQIAIERLKSFEPEEGYFLAFSGGKDSCVIKELANISGVRYEAHYSHTTVDPPELIYYMREQHPDVIVDYPEKTMWELIIEKRMPPTRIVRYCCDVLKEQNGNGRVVVTGVRWAESVRRKQNRNLVNISKGKKRIAYNEDNDESRRMVENCMSSHKVTVNPIIDWTDGEVWEFIEKHNVPYCKLYDEGFTRIGCIGCPMNTKAMIRDFERWPKYKEQYIRTFQRMHDRRIADGLKTYNQKNGQDWFNWWVGKSQIAAVSGMEGERMLM